MDQITDSLNHQNVQSQEANEQDIKKLLIDFSAAIRSGQIEKIMEFYDREVVAFDMMPPLQILGTYRYQKTWEECFTNYFEFPVQFEYAEQVVYVHGDVAYTHSLIHMSGKSKDGKSMESWMRNTTCLRKVQGTWKITHEHNSVPLEMETGKGMMDLKPDELTH